MPKSRYRKIAALIFVVRKLPAMPGVQKSFSGEQKCKRNLTYNPSDYVFKAT
jgi:hypothetical protein